MVCGLNIINMNKKGIINWMFIVILMGIIAIIWVLIKLIFDKIHTELLLVEEVANNPTSVGILASGSTAINGFDIGFAVVFFGLGLISIWVGSSLLATSKVLMPIFLFILFIVIIFGVVFSNMYESYITSDDSIASAAAGYPIITHILLKFPLYVGLIGLAIFFATYAKTKSQEQQGISLR